MGRTLISATVLCAMLGACAPQIPDSGAVVQTVQPAPAPAPVVTTQAPSAAPLDAINLGNQPAAAQPLPSSITAAVNGDPAETAATTAAAAANSGVAPVEASPSNPPPQQVNSAGISTEQDFSVVSSQRTIQSDAQRIAANRAQYQVIAPTALPQRSGGGGPNIVDYALATNNPVGTQLYRRSGLRLGQRGAAACASFPSPDQAQIEFLKRGGPQRDRKGLDPDGDGYACSWDPRPFRSARAAAQPAAPVQQSVASAPAAQTSELFSQTPPQAPAERVTQAAPGIAPPLVISSE